MSKEIHYLFETKEEEEVLLEYNKLLFSSKIKMSIYKEVEVPPILVFIIIFDLLNLRKNVTEYIIILGWGIIFRFSDFSSYIIYWV